MASDKGDLVRGDTFHDIEPPSLKQAVFEQGLIEALDQPTDELRHACLDKLEHQVKRRKVA